ncbi:MAG: hypothetical protein HKO13_03575 [Sphingomonas sp.]|nr:hypothetical protein [Sphingomonas sp.]
MINRKNLRRWHVWLGWLIGVPFLIWTVSGLVMVWKPIEEVRGEHLVAPAAAIPMTQTVTLPDIPEGAMLDSMRLESRASGPVWVVTLEGEETRLADPATGSWIEPYGVDEATAEFMARYTGDSKIAEVRRTDANHPPMDWRRNSEAWQIVMANGDHFYVDPASGSIAARRTGWWRIFDFFWGLHIMDLQTREDTSNLWIKSFAILGIIATLMALVLLPMTSRRKKKKKKLEAEQAA